MADKNVVAKFIGQLWPRKLTTRDLMRRESEMGKQLFGEIPEGHEREFFCLDDHTWVWHETWKDENGKTHDITTRYEVHQNRIIKVQSGQPNRIVKGEEAERLARATQWYYHLVSKHIYGLST